MTDLDTLAATVEDALVVARRIAANPGVHGYRADYFDRAEHDHRALVEHARTEHDRADRYEKALRDACDVAIWLSALLRNPDGANDPVAWETWERDMRPRLHSALDVLPRPRAALAGKDA